MRLSLAGCCLLATTTIFLATPTSLAHTAVVNVDCDQVKVVECFIQFLSDWAWKLWSIRESIAALNRTSCDIHAKIRGCLSVEPLCNIKDAVEISKVVTDLLQHKKDSGTFLRSVFAMEYACTTPGLQVIAENHECLHSHHIGNQLLDKVKEFGDEFEEMEKTPDDFDSSVACAKLTDKAHKARDQARDGCSGNEHAGKLICHSVAAPFRKLNEDRFKDCFPCRTDLNEAEDPPEPEKVDLPANDKTAVAEGQNGKTSGGRQPVALPIVSLISTLLVVMMLTIAYST